MLAFDKGTFWIPGRGKMETMIYTQRYTCRPGGWEKREFSSNSFHFSMRSDGRSSATMERGRRERGGGVEEQAQSPYSQLLTFSFRSQCNSPSSGLDFLHLCYHNGLQKNLPHPALLLTPTLYLPILWKDPPKS